MDRDLAGYRPDSSLGLSWATPYGNTGVAPELGQIIEHAGLPMLAGIGMATFLLILASGTARFAIGNQLTAAELLPSDALFRRLAGTRDRRIDRRAGRVPAAIGRRLRRARDRRRHSCG